MNTWQVIMSKAVTGKDSPAYPLANEEATIQYQLGPAVMEIMRNKLIFQTFQFLKDQFSV